MSRDVYVLRADLEGFPGVHRTIAVCADQTLEHVHHALQAVFGWDDDHLYSFWLSGEFWARDGGEYTHPWHAAEPNPLDHFTNGPAPKSAKARLDRLGLEEGQRIAYLFDFGDEWRVALTLRQIILEDGQPYPRLLESAGEAPPQYPDDEDVEEVA